MTEVSLRGLIEIASDILAGVFREVSDAWAPPEETDWEIYDTET
jgi:hypothetical protein